MLKIEIGNWRFRRQNRLFRKPIYILEIEFREVIGMGPSGCRDGMMTGNKYWWEPASSDHFGRNEILRASQLIERYKYQLK